MNIVNHHPLREALVHQTNSHCQHLKFVENSMENLHTDVRVLKVNNFFCQRGCDGVSSGESPSGLSHL